MAVKLLERLAARAPVPVFVAMGRDRAPAVERLLQSADIDVTATPRHASILLVAGRVRDSDQAYLDRIHDQLPHPRATFWWGDEQGDDVDEAQRAASFDDPVISLRALYRNLISGAHASETHRLPDEPPAPWRGKGDHGQGGEGMMGGVPYGRMMPMPPTPDIRDGLALDVYTTQIGPFMPYWPAGLVLEVTFQGDVIQSAEVVQPPYPPRDVDRVPFDRLLHETTALAQIERARAAHHLVCIARLLSLVGLPTLSRRAQILAARVRANETIAIAPLRKAAARSGLTAALAPGLGRIDDRLARELGGPAQRAAGHAIDDRSDNPMYKRLDFTPVTQTQSDCRARLAQWFDEAEQALALVSAAPDAMIGQGALVEAPWALRAPPVDYRLTELLPGLEWSEALLVLNSFDSAALCRMAPLEAP